MQLNKDDYSNILKLLEGVEIKGVQAAKYVAVLAHKIEHRVATWIDGSPTGFSYVDPTATQPIDILPDEPLELN